MRSRRVLGVAFALQEHDIKRLLAYHSVENIGIILLGVGASMAAMALNSVGIAVLALMAALYHTFNHAMFKGELFLGRRCAAVLHGYAQYGEDGRPVPSYAGYGHLLPHWRACHLGHPAPSTALFPSGLPISRSLTPPCQGDKAVMIVAVFAAVALAITGALAVTCFVKAYGVSFASAPRSEAAANAKEVPAPMVFAQGLLAAICVVLGIGAPVIAPVLVDVAASVLHPYGGVFAAEGMELMNQYSGAATSTPAIAIALVVLVGLACGYRKLKTVGKVQKSQPWACGYAPNEHMPSWPRPLPPRCPGLCSRSTRCATAARLSAGPSRTSSRSSPVWPRLWSPYPTRFSSMPRIRVSRNSPTSRLSSRAANYSIYICYIVAALVVFLVLAVQMG